MIKLIIAEDNDIVRNGLAHLLNQAEDIDIIAIASNGREAIRLMESGRIPDMVLTDYIMPELDGLELSAYLKRHHSSVKVVMLSFREDKALGRNMKAAGIRAYVGKDEDFSVLMKVIREVDAGKIFLS